MLNRMNPACRLFATKGPGDRSRPCMVAIPAAAPAIGRHRHKLSMRSLRSNSESLTGFWRQISFFEMDVQPGPAIAVASHSPPRSRSLLANGSPNPCLCTPLDRLRHPGAPAHSSNQETTRVADGSGHPQSSCPCNSNTKKARRETGPSPFSDRRSTLDQIRRIAGIAECRSTDPC